MPIQHNPDNFYQGVRVYDFENTSIQLEEDDLKNSILVTDCRKVKLTLKRCKKVTIDGCHDCEIFITGQVIGGLEISNSSLVDIHINSRLLCVQAELCTSLRIYVGKEYEKLFKIMHEQCVGIQVFNEAQQTKYVFMHKILIFRNTLPEAHSRGKGSAQYAILNMNQILHSSDSSLMKQLLLKNSSRDISIVSVH
jgi:hypothetical protein